MNQALAFCAVGTLYYPGFHRGTEPKDICMCIYILREREIYYKKLAHMIIEAKKPSSLPSASWRPRKSGGLILKAWEPESWWYRFQSRSEGLRAKSREGRRPTSKLTQEESKFNLPLPFYFVQALNGLDDAHPHWGGQSAFSNAKHLHRHTQK